MDCPKATASNRGLNVVSHLSPEKGNATGTQTVGHVFISRVPVQFPVRQRQSLAQSRRGAENTADRDWSSLRPGVSARGCVHYVISVLCEAQSWRKQPLPLRGRLLFPIRPRVAAGGAACTRGYNPVAPSGLAGHMTFFPYAMG